MVVTKGATLLALYDVAREFMSITSAKIDTREERETGKVTEVFSHIFHNPSKASINPSIYNTICWVAWTMGQTNYRPSV